MARRVNYDEIAPIFDARYASGAYNDLLRALRGLVAARRPGRALEVGCGTGYWLEAIRDLVPGVIGLDYSLEMLRRARQKPEAGGLVRGTAEILPFRGAAFDLVFCVNALHHFGEIESFIKEARRLLRAGGVLAIIGMDPHHGRDSWCVYDYFPETKATDLRRYPSSGQIADTMLRAGFDGVESRMDGRFGDSRVGLDVFNDPELRRNGCSQMTLLSDAEYAEGIERINAALRDAPGGVPPVFKNEIAVMLHCGHVAAPR
ncbi:MAG TPA: class I SAM-dependent methyltransferase [Candidatus Binataceae bacterium]|nr:class I SAM-dependent methyltransferase [Candidatus Binataceae bacterium]